MATQFRVIGDKNRGLCHMTGSMLVMPCLRGVRPGSMLKFIFKKRSKSPPRVRSDGCKLLIKGAPGGFVITRRSDGNFKSVYGAYGASREEVISAEKVAHLVWERKCRKSSIAALLKLGWIDVLRKYKELLNFQK